MFCLVFSILLNKIILYDCQSIVKPPQVNCNQYLIGGKLIHGKVLWQVSSNIYLTEKMELKAQLSLEKFQIWMRKVLLKLWMLLWMHLKEEKALANHESERKNCLHGKICSHHGHQKRYHS